MPASDASIVPRKTVLGSYIIMRHIASGGMGTVWEGWLNPYAELGTSMIKGQAVELRSIAGVKSKAPTLTDPEIRRIRQWVMERTAEFVDRPDPSASFSQTYSQMLEYVAPHRRVGGGFRRAIKVLDEQLARNQKVVQRFLKEVDILARTLNHSRIIKVVEAGQAAGKYYAVLEYVPTLDLEDEKLTIPQALRVTREALEGLIHAHEQGILHRDLKPANILASRDLKVVKLSDFGIAKALDESSDGKLTSTGVIVGTPHYMDPERARGEAMGTESDVYALGATFYKLLTGEPPVLGQSPLDTMGQIGQDKDVPWVRERNPRVSEDLEDVLMMMLAKDRRVRPTAYEVRDLLARIEERSLVFHQEPTENQRRSMTGAIKALRKEIRRLRAAASRGSDAERAGAAERMCAKVAEQIDLLPRDDAASISLRIDTLREAWEFVDAALEGRRGDAVKRAARGAAFLRKKLDLENRRLSKRGLRYVVKKPRRIGRKAFFAIAGAAIIAMAALFTLAKVREARAAGRVDRLLEQAAGALDRGDDEAALAALRQAREAAGDLAQSSAPVRKIATLERRARGAAAVGEAERRYAAVKDHLAQREYSRASEEIDAALAALDSLPGDVGEDLASRSRELRARVEADRKRITRYATDIRVYAGLMESYGQAKAGFDRLRADRKDGKEVPPAAVAALEEQVSGILGKLRDANLVNPDAIGPEREVRLDEVQATLDALRRFRLEE